MDVLLNLLLFTAGLVILYFGAEATLNGSVRIACRRSCLTAR